MSTKSKNGQTKTVTQTVPIVALQMLKISSNPAVIIDRLN
jgi:hypothetical protein